MKKFSDFLKERCWPGYKSVPGKKAYSPGSCVKEDLRQWFDKDHPKGGWKRINSKGEAIGPCAREPGEPKPKCMSNEKRAKLSKKERASAVASKRKHDPNPERKGEPINVSNFGKGKISEDMENLDEKNVPTSPEKWAQAKAQAKAKFDVYPSAYANGWASKKYKEMGGGWKSVSEEVKDKYDEGEYDQEGDMAKSDLRSIIANAKKMHDMIKDDDNLPEWVQSKITKAEDYISTVANYMAAEMSEGVELDEADQKFIDSLNKLAKTHKVGDSVTVNSKFFGKQKGKVTKVDNQSVHVVRDGKKLAEKYPHNAVVKEASDNGGTIPTPAAETLTVNGQPKLSKTVGQTKMIPFVHEAKETKPPFDGPYTTTKAVIKDKSGAKHTPMSRARDLARKAMARNMKEQANIKPNPFTVPEIDIGKAPKKTKATMSESRQLEIVREAMKVAKKKKEVTEAGTDKFFTDPELASQITKS